MEESESSFCREAVEAALGLHALDLWRKHPHDAIFAIRVPTEEHPLVASLLGSGGTATGLALTRGPNALLHMRSLVSRQTPDDDLQEEISHLILTFAPYGTLPPHRREFLDRAGFSGGDESPAPLFLAKLPHRNPREIDAAETRIFLYVLHGVRRAAEKGLLRPAPTAPNATVLLLAVEGEPLSPEVSSRPLAFASRKGFDDAALTAAPGELRDLPRTDERWLVGLPVLPAVIDDDDRTLRALLVAEEGADAVLALHLVMGGDIDAASEALCRTFLGENSLGRRALPSEIVFSSRSLFDAVSPALTVFDVRCSHEPRIPHLAEIVARLERDLFRR